MKKLLSAAVVLTFAWAGVASAHGPSRQKQVETIEINAAPAKVWDIIKDFGKPEAWMPMVASTTAQGGNAAGATRELTLKKGGVIKEELKTYEADKMSFAYKISENPDCAVLPVNNYSSNIVVEASGSGAKVTWSGAYYRCFLANNPPPDQNEESANKAIEAVYKESLANLKALAEKQ
ncbi:MAG: MxaD protein [Proteobacteria bacterium]|nr:MxaD protein [Pseudomonadota bacterium]